MKINKIFIFSSLILLSINTMLADVDEYDPVKIPDNLHNSTNMAAMKLLKLPELWGEPYNLSGEGVKIAIFDWGQVRATHQEFQKNSHSRIHIMGKNKEQPPHPHSSFIAGAIGAKGVNPNAKGAAENVEIYSYWVSEASYARAVLKAYEEEGITLSNHAYLYTDTQYDGVYDSEAKLLDKVVYDNPYLNVFMAGGNDRGHDDEENYKQLKGPRTCKNVFTIAVTMDDGRQIAPYSNRGPVNDGRIKPDFSVAAPGNSYVLSTGNKADDDYILQGGTTSATARTIGSSALLLQLYKNITGRDKIRHDILKALFINTATDRGRKGPDYIFGFGTINPKDVADAIWTLKTKKPLIREENIKENEIKKYKLSLTHPGSVKITLVWVDPEGEAEIPNLPQTQKPTLVNDIDMWIERGNNRYYPFSLDPKEVTKPATAEGFNRVDNVEQIVIENAPAGEYIINLKGYRIKTDDQDYALVCNYYLEPFNKADENEQSKENFVKRYYNIILDREGDQEDINYWDTQLTQKNMSALDLAEFFFNSKEFKEQNNTTKDFIQKVYKVMLNRDADSEGEDYWINRIENKTTSNDLIIYEFGFSKEFGDICKKYDITPYSSDNYLDAFIKRLYILVLEREYDPGGLNEWKESLQNKDLSIEKVVKSFFFSKEFSDKNISNKKFIKIAYLTILGREASDEEISFWSSKLDNNEMNKEEILNNFLNSEEFSELVKKYNLEAK